MLNTNCHFIHKLNTKYNNVYLIRNERKVKYREIDDVRGFMPDFLLFLEDESVTYQFFVEPKGTNLQDHDRWKEGFLLALTERDDIEVCFLQIKEVFVGWCRKLKLKE